MIKKLMKYKLLYNRYCWRQTWEGYKWNCTKKSRRMAAVGH